jgi:hypothetical protein
MPGAEDPDLRAAQEILREVEEALIRAAEVLRQARESLAMAGRAPQERGRRLGEPPEAPPWPPGGSRAAPSPGFRPPGP